MPSRLAPVGHGLDSRWSTSVMRTLHPHDFRHGASARPMPYFLVSYRDHGRKFCPDGEEDWA